MGATGGGETHHNLLSIRVRSREALLQPLQGFLEAVQIPWKGRCSIFLQSVHCMHERVALVLSMNLSPFLPMKVVWGQLADKVHL